MRAKSRPKLKAPSATITNCHFVGVHWDKDAVEAVVIVARALENLTSLFRSQGLQVPMIQIGGDTGKGNA